MRRSWLLFVPLMVASACAKAPPSTAIPYDGFVGSGKDWNLSVDHVELTIDLEKRGRTISPLIYGYNQVRDPERYGVASLRAGGNRFTAYNWENNASNAGHDFMFQNDGFLVAGSTTPDSPGDAVRPTLETARRIGATAVVTIPIVDYVSADKLGNGDVTGSADYLNTRFKQNKPTRGGGAPSSAAAASPDVTDAFVYQDEFVTWVVNTYPDLSLMFSLDNEPDLWSQTHKEVHPSPVTYDELVKRNSDYARAIKGVWPWAPVLGFVSYGWQGYLSLNGAPDAGKGDFVDYYLTQMKAAEDSDGQRLIDCLDLHWYPEAEGIGTSGNPTRIVFTSPDNASGMVEARVQAPRSLWDPNYREQSWIGGPIALIPRMQQKIDAHYPKTQLAFTEWNYGGGGDISGGVATADVLGIFGREGVAVANIWPSGPGAFTSAAVSVFRNFDGAGAAFGDVSISAQTTSIYSSSVYASLDSTNPSRVVVVAINKRPSTTTATVRILGGSSISGVAVWLLTGTNPVLQPAPALAATTSGTFTYEMPALSVTVLVPTSDSPSSSGPDAGANAPSDGSPD
jgi:Glycoside hydrolase family 44